MTQPWPPLRRRELKTTPAWATVPRPGLKEHKTSLCGCGVAAAGTWEKAPSVPHTLHRDSESHHQLHHSQDQSKAQPRHLLLIPKPEAASGWAWLRPHFPLRLG